MSFRLPTADHPARELMDIRDVAAKLNPRDAHLLRHTWQALRDARDAFESDTAGAMRRICYIVVRADTDEKWLISVGPRGGWKKEWNFGTGRD